MLRTLSERRQKIMLRLAHTANIAFALSGVKRLGQERRRAFRDFATVSKRTASREVSDEELQG